MYLCEFFLLQIVNLQVSNYYILIKSLLQQMQSISAHRQQNCLGCKKIFKIGQKVPLESMTIQFKNYSIPIKDQWFKFTLLKTIIAFLNSKGGTIYMGVNDYTGTVQGFRLSRKLMDQFKLSTKQMLDKIYPQIDLVKSQQVSIEFIPVLQEQDNFYGRYVVKFVILQGDPSQTYCTLEKVSTTEDSYEVPLSYRRHNMGGIEEIKGQKLLQEIYLKATKPHQKTETFHVGCNPFPEVPILMEKPQLPKSPQKLSKEDLSNYSVSNSGESKKKQSPNNTLNKIVQEINGKDKNQRDYQRNKELDNYNYDSKPIVQETKYKADNYTNNGVWVQISNINIQYYETLVKFCTYNIASQIKKNFITNRDNMQNIQIKFKDSYDKENFLEQVKKPKIQSVMKQFGKQGGLSIKHKDVNFKQNRPSMNTEKKSKQTSDKFSYILVFQNCQEKFRKSLENYLEKCMSSNIARKSYYTSQGLQLSFKSKSDMNVFYKLCTEKPHSNQINHYGKKGGIRIMITKSKPQIEEQTKKKTYVKKEATQYQHQQPKRQKQLPIKVTKQNFPTIEERQQPTGTYELLASSLDPSQMATLINYLKNNMFYNIQKTIQASQCRYWLKLKFNHLRDSNRFLELCKLQIHHKILAQYTLKGPIRIGYAGEKLIITPFNQEIKNVLRTKIMTVLGSGVIRSSEVNIISGQISVWVLNLVDPTKILKAYSILEEHFQRDCNRIKCGNELIKLRVFVDYVSV